LKTRNKLNRTMKSLISVFRNLEFTITISITYSIYQDERSNFQEPILISISALYSNMPIIFWKRILFTSHILLA